MDEIELAWARAWLRPDRREIYEWARENVDLQGDYALQGFFRVDSSRHLVFPFGLLLDDQVRMVNVRKAIQSGGTLLADLFFQYIFANAPGPAMFSFQTDDDAEQHFLTRIEPTLRASPANREQHRRLQKKRDLYRWPHINAYFQGANWNSLQRKSVRYVVNDECWIWKEGMLAESWARTHAFRDICKILNISQAGMVGDDWDNCWEAGRRHSWAVKCVKCRQLQPLLFFDTMADDPHVKAGVIYTDTRKGGRWDVARAAESARYRCRHCGHEHADDVRTWDRFNAGGDYICHDPERPGKNVSVEWNGLVAGHYGDVVADFLKAKQLQLQGTVEPLKKLYQKTLILPWEDRHGEEIIVLTTSKFLRREPWPAGEWRFLVADYQEGRAGQGEYLRFVCRDFAEGGPSRLVDEGTVGTPEELRALQHELGIENDRCVAVDGGHQLLRIAGWAAKYGWTVLCGDDKEAWPHYPKRKGKRSKKPVMRAYSPRKRVDPLRGKKGAGRYLAYVFHWSNPSVKDFLWRLRHGRGVAWEVAEDVSDNYRAELDAERKQRVWDKLGRKYREWWINIAPDKANHAWDCECMLIVLAMIAGILAFDLEDDDEDPPPEEKKPPAKPEAPHDRPDQLELLSH